jgi:carbamoyl-phosphate synthase small subunit
LGVQVSGFVVREASRRASSWRATRTIHDDLASSGVVAIEGIDTRRLTLRLREHGAMRGGVSTVDPVVDSLLERVRAQPGMDGTDLAARVSTPVVYEAAELFGPASAGVARVMRVAAFDFGMKRNILRRLAEVGIEATVFPAATPPDRVLAGGFDGALLSNGPGDPAATRYGIEAAEGLLGHVPLFGICLGHQLMGLALGGRTYKMPFGHRGANQPVKDLRTGRVEVTSHNHGFAIDPAGWSRAGNLAETTLGRVELTHWNLNDGTLEGLVCLDVPAFSVQYHPEAAPGPHDARGLFDEFRVLMEAA